MKHENGYWIDKNGNRWSDRISEAITLTTYLSWNRRGRTIYV